MQGFFDVQVKDAPGLSDEFFKRLSPKELDAVLDELRTVQRAPWHKNLIYHRLVSWIFDHVMSGAGVGYPYDSNGINSGGLANLTLLTYDAEPAYTGQDSAGYWSPNTVAGNIGGTCGKRFVEDETESYAIAVTPLKEELYYRARFLFTPSQAVSNNIRTISYYYADTADSSSNSDRGVMGRVRLKDSGGSPVVLNKTAAQVLLVQVIFKLATL